MSEKMILPSDAMVAAGYEAGEIMQRANRSFGAQCRWAIYAALNHPDARGLFTDEDARPWEPLNKDTLLCRGDEVRRVVPGITTTAVVARVDEVDALWTAGGTFIGRLDFGTWYVRRPVKELPEADGAVIVPADGYEYIETRVGKKSRRLTWDAECLVWYDARGTHLYGDITPGTWKVDDR